VPRKYVVLLAIAATVIVLDQWTKYLVLRDLTSAYEGAETLGARLGRMFSSAPPQTDPFDSYHYRRSGSYTLSASFMRFQYAENPGAAWGLFRTLPDGVRGPLFHVVSIGAVILISYYFTKLSGKNPKERWALFGLPLVLGGAIGNYIDRLARGFVIDFLEAHWFDNPGLTWPSFNIADSAICVGVAMLLIDSFVRREKAKKVATA
jgi:signal peptidase II